MVIGMKSSMNTENANVILSIKAPSGEVHTTEGKFFRSLKALRSGGYVERFRMDVRRGGKWRRYIQNASSISELVEMAKRNGYEVSAA
jgi:predicted transcriptional regulator